MVYLESTYAEQSKMSVCILEVSLVSEKTGFNNTLPRHDCEVLEMGCLG